MCTSVRQGLHLLTLHDPQLSGSPFFFFSCYRHHRYLHSFPTRRSSDLLLPHLFTLAKHCVLFEDVPQVSLRDVTVLRSAGGDRKSTRLNSSHRCISYAVFCLKKKKKNIRVHLKRPYNPPLPPQHHIYPS